MLCWLAVECGAVPAQPPRFVKSAPSPTNLDTKKENFRGVTSVGGGMELADVLSIEMVAFSKNKN